MSSQVPRYPFVLTSVILQDTKQPSSEKVFKTTSPLGSRIECLKDVAYWGDDHPFRGTPLDANTFIDEVQKRRPKHIMLFVHGFHSQPHEIFKNAARAQQFFATQMPQKGVLVIPLIWPCDDSSSFQILESYQADREAAYKTGSFLQDWLLKNNRFFSSVFAHSMGNWVLQSTFQPPPGAVWSFPSSSPSSPSSSSSSSSSSSPPSKPLPKDFFEFWGKAFMVAPDIDFNAFDESYPSKKDRDSDAESDKVMFSARPIAECAQKVVVYYSSKDLALKLSGGVLHKFKRLGSGGASISSLPSSIRQRVENSNAKEISAKVGAPHHSYQTHDDLLARVAREVNLRSSL